MPPYQTLHHHHHGTLLGLLGLLFMAPAARAQQPPPDSAHDYSSPTTTALIVLIILFFSAGFVSVYIRHYLACFGVGAHGGDDVGVGSGARRRETARGLDSAIIDAFPTVLYSDVKVHRVGKTTPLECAVCLNEFADHELLRLLPRCSHVFHPHCIGPWLASHVTCPVCRANLEIQVLDQPPLDTLAQLSEDESEPSNQIIRPHDDDDHRDVIVRVEASASSQMMKKDEVSVRGRVGKFPRSHSTGHSLVEDCERYTLRLPEEVRSKLVKVNHLSGLPAAMVSPRIGYRHRLRSTIKPDRWRFSMSPPFISRSGSAIWSPKSDGSSKGNLNNHGSNTVEIMRSPRSIFKSIKSPLNRVVRSDDIGERSSDRLWSNHELEGH